MECWGVKRNERGKEVGRDGNKGYTKENNIVEQERQAIEIGKEERREGRTKGTTEWMERRGEYGNGIGD